MLKYACDSNTLLIVEVGQALWGDSWQAPMARALGVNKSTVQDWKQGHTVPKAGVWKELTNMIRERIVVLKRLESPASINGWY